jgi:colanic acid biosynthesis glycosyl transferase WcaI
VGIDAEDNHVVRCSFFVVRVPPIVRRISTKNEERRTKNVLRVVFINRYFPPDHSATSQMVGDLAFFLARRGHDVVTIASRQRYDDARARLAGRERVGGVDVVRVATTRFGRGFLPGRALDYATFYVSAFVALLRRARRGDVVVALTDPPLISVVAALACALRGARLVNWVQDLFPEVATALGMRGPGLTRRLRDWSLRRAAMNVALGEQMAERIRARGARATVRHNWADAALHPVARASNALRGQWQLGDAFVVAYSGNLGRAHEFATIGAAMRRLGDNAGINFLFVGSGAQLDAVRSEAGGNALFAPYQPREALSESLSAGDAHLVSLQPQLEGLIVPSKFYGILAVARPVIFVGAAGGELARLITAHGLGYVVAPGDDAALARAIEELAADPERAAAMGRRGRALYDERFAPEIALAEWERILA